MAYDKIASNEVIKETLAALAANGITAIIAENGGEAKARALELIPEGSEVMTMTSITNETIGLTREINESGKYKSVKNELGKMNRQTQEPEMQKLGAAPEYATGSVHAITKDGKIIVASNTGSQLPAYLYGSSHVVWVVGAQKIVKDVEDGIKRINEYIVPKESIRARKAYGLPETWNTNPSKIAIIGREIKPGRLTVILSKEPLGF